MIGITVNSYRDVTGQKISDLQNTGSYRRLFLPEFVP